MAEAAVESVSPKYFCHQCSEGIRSVLPDYTCPRCFSGFIEEVEVIPDEEDQSSDNSLYVDEGSESDQSFGRENNSQRNFADILENLFSSAGLSASGNQGSNPVNSHSQSTPSDSHSNVRSNDANTRRSVASGGSNPHVLQFRFQTRDQQGQAGGTTFGPSLDIIQQILSNMTDQQPAQGNRGMINIDFPLPLFQVLHGNPGDYAWGNGGLDAVITQLLNQLDGSGPPPMPKAEIDQIPTVAITQDQLDKNMQCSVCMEDFKLGEKVRQLNCAHCFHNDCILPWLQLHGTCPICRKELNENNSNQARTRRRSNQRRFSNSNTSNSFGGASGNYEFTDDYD